MYSNFKELIIGSDEIGIVTVDGNEYNYKLDEYIDSWRPVRCQLLKTDDVEIRCDNRYIYITDYSRSESLADVVNFQIFFPYDVRAIVDKDLRNGNMFELGYRQHLRQLYSKKEMTVINMNYIPETVYGRSEQIKEMAEKFSQGKSSKPVVIMFYNELKAFDNLHYTILKDSTVVESGVI